MKNFNSVVATLTMTCLIIGFGSVYSEKNYNEIQEEYKKALKTMNVIIGQRNKLRDDLSAQNALMDSLKAKFKEIFPGGEEDILGHTDKLVRLQNSLNKENQESDGKKAKDLVSRIEDVMLKLKDYGVLVGSLKEMIPSQVSNFQEAGESLKEKIVSFVDKYNVLVEKYNITVKGINKLKGQIKDKNSELRKRRAESRKLQKELDKEKRQKEELLVENKDLTKNVEIMQNELNKLEATLKETNSELQAVSSYLVDLVSYADQNKTEIS